MSTSINGIGYDYSGTTATVAGLRGSLPTNWNIVLLNTITVSSVTYAVTSISDIAFRNVSNLLSINIPNNVTLIGNNAFENCTSLTSATIGVGVQRLGNSCFRNTVLRNIVLPNNLASIGNNAFQIVTTLSSVSIPNNVTSIGNYAFESCSNLASISIGNRVTTLGDFCFQLSGLTSIFIPTSVTSIGANAFRSCFSLTSANLGSVQTLGEYSFYNTGLTSIVIPDSATSLGERTFSNCFKLASATIGSRLQNISDGCFEGAIFTSIVIPNSVTIIDRNAFAGCNYLTSMDIGTGVTTLNNFCFDFYKPPLASEPSFTSLTFQNPNLISSVGFRIFNELNENLIVYYKRVANYNLLSEIMKKMQADTFDPLPNKIYVYNDTIYVRSNVVYQIDTSDASVIGTTNLQQDFSMNIISSISLNGRSYPVTSIANNALQNLTNLLSVIIPSSVTSIGENAMAGCSRLTSAAIGSGVQTLGINSFQGSGLRSVVVPDNVTSIGAGAFSNCLSLTSATLGSKVQTLGDSCFSQAPLSSLTFKNPNVIANVPTTGVFSGLDDNLLVYYNGIENYNALNGTQKSMQAEYFDKLNNEIYVYNNAYAIDKLLYQINAPYVSVIGTNNPPTDWTLDIPSSVTINAISYAVTSIASNAFQNLTNLLSVAVPNSVLSIGASAIAKCSRLTSVEIGFGVQTLGDNCFQLSGLISIVIPDNVISIGAGAFNSCFKLTSVSIGSGLQNLSINCFQGSGLTSVVIPNNVTSIGASAFSSCFALTSATIGIKVQTLDNNCFSGDPLSSLTFQNPNMIANVPTTGVFSGLNNNLIVNYNGIANYNSLNDRQKAMQSNYFDRLNNETYVYTNGYAQNSLVYQINDTSVSLIGTNNPPKDWILAIPSSVTINTIRYPVTSIASNAFQNLTTLLSVVIPDSVTLIGNNAFNGCISLASVAIGVGVQTLGDNCFQLSGLISIVIPDNIISIGTGAFSSCSKLTAASIGSGIKALSISCFQGADLRSIFIPNNVTSIGESAFSSCFALTSATIGLNVQRLDNNCFSGAPLSSLTFQNPNIITNVPTIGVFSGLNDNLIVIYNGIANYNALSLTQQAMQTNYFDILNNETYIYTNGYAQNSLVYQINNASVSVIGTNNPPKDWILAIPSSVMINLISYPVTSIANNAFKNLPTLLSVAIPNSVTSIETEAFRSCNKLTSATIGSSVQTLGEACFAETALETIVIPNSVITIRNYAFYVCSKLASATIGSSVQTLGIACFQQTALTSIIIPDSLTSIESSTFYQCSKLASAVIGSSVQNLLAFCFAETALTSIIIPNNVTFIGDNAFIACTSLTSATLGLKVNKLDNSCFSGVPLSSITFQNPNVLTNVPSTGVFSGLNNNLIVYYKGVANYNALNDTQKSMQFNYFDRLNNETYVYNDNAYAINNLLYQINENGSSVSLIGTNNPPKDWALVIPSSVAINAINYPVNSIANNALENLTILLSVVIPTSVTSIGENAMDGCTSLTSVTIGSGVENLGNSCFSGAPLSSLTFQNPDSVLNIGTTLFSGLNDDLNVYYNGVVNYNALNVNQKTLQAEYFDKLRNEIYVYTNSFVQNSVIYEIDSLNNSNVSVTGTINSPINWQLTIPSTIKVGSVSYIVSSIGENAFANLFNIVSIVIPNSVTSIGNNSFYQCTILTSAILGSSIQTLGNGCFQQTGLRSIVIPDSVTMISYNAFYQCSSLKSAIIGSNVKTLGEGCFQQTDLTSIVIPDNVTMISHNAFYQCTNLASAIIGTSVQIIGENAFNSCISLTSVTIGTGVTNLQNNCFAGVPLTYLMFQNPNNITSFGRSLFSGLNNNLIVNYNGVQDYNSLSADQKSIQSAYFDSLSNKTYVYVSNIINSNLIFDYFVNHAHVVGFLNPITNWNLIIPATVSDGANSYNVVSINEKTFEGITDLVSVVISENITSVSKSTFNGCTSLTSVTLGSSVQTLETNCFNNTALSSITFKYPNALKNFETNIFSGLSNDLIVYYNSITTFDSLNETQKLMQVDYFDALTNENYVYDVAIGDVVYNVAGPTVSITGVDDPPEDWRLSIPESVTIGGEVLPVTGIANNAFLNSTTLLSVVIPTSVDTIGASSFEGCVNLQGSSPYLIIPDSITSIGENAFRGCVSLTSLNLGANVQTLGNGCFLNIPFQSIYFQSPNRLVSFGSNIFNQPLSTLQLVTYYYAPSGLSDLNEAMVSLKNTYFTGASFSYQASCFNQGTKILCLENDMEKYINVEDLTLDTLVKTYLHGYKKVKRIGCGSFMNNPENHLFCMYKLAKEDNDDLIEDLILTGQHSILVDFYQASERTKNKNLRFQETIDDKKLLLAFVGNKFKKMMDNDTYTFYNFALESETGEQRYGVYANGILCETPSINSMDKKESEFETILKHD